ncbi:TIGR03086 family metal-binding protein [Streptomyces sp. NPDC050433]|uniref:TIGR03086 family metal-binding protein n=1 Tax=Streptomyces sp. NPDC050433 TaxID=3365615 RepID=UPI00378B1379
MDNPLLVRHGEALDLFTDRVHAVGADQWGTSTPCAAWSVRDLVNHLTAEQLWVPPLVTDGRTMAEVGDAFDGDVLGDDPVAAWDRAAAASRAAFAGRGALQRPVPLSYGATKADAYCSQMVLDAVVHTWDLSRGIGANERLPGPLVDFALEEIKPYAESLSQSGLFDPPLDPPRGADAQTRLLAMVGREA